MKLIKDHGETVEFELQFPGIHGLVSVKKEFLQIVPEPWNSKDKDTEQHFFDLFTKYGMTDYLHNLSGPAYTNLLSNDKQYFIDGKKINDLEEAFKHINK